MPISCVLNQDLEGIVTDNYEYDAFGTLLGHLDAPETAYLFSGEQFDFDLGMYFLRARYLSLVSGRSLGMDNFEEARGATKLLNKYLYASQDPLNEIDPSGMFSEEIGAAYDAASAVASNAFRRLFSAESTNPTGTHIYVNIWPFLGSSEAWGHASLTIEGPTQTYISWWPELEDDTKIPLSGIQKLARRHPAVLGWGLESIFTSPAIKGRTFEQDVKDEKGRTPDQIEVSRLDSGRIHQWWLEWQDTISWWSTLGPNCSSVVLEALRAGGATPIALFGTPSIVTPNLISRVAKRIGR